MAIQHGRTHLWQRSSHSGGNGACVEVRSPVPHSLAVRDSKTSCAGPGLGFRTTVWTAFIEAVTDAGNGPANGAR